MNEFHTSVLLRESVAGLNVKDDGIYVDATFGGGGHSKEIIKLLSNGKLIAFDQDQETLKNKIEKNNKFIMINKNFRYLKKYLKAINISNIDGLIADLGVSEYHFTNNNRGFSLQYDAPIDMRMDKTLLKDGAFIVNNYNRKELDRIFKNHADFKNPNRITTSIMKCREDKVIKTISDLKNIFNDGFWRKHQNKFFARIFQAIRIEVNDEINSLKELLTQSLELLNPSGRLVVISYHSIEDKIVKSFMKFGNFLNRQDKDFFGNQHNSFKLITKKPTTPTITEIKSNNKSRSAKLRICEKL